MALCTMTNCERKANYQVRGTFGDRTWRVVKVEEEGRYCRTCADIREKGYNRMALEHQSQRTRR